MIHLCYTPKVNLIGQAMPSLPKSVENLVKMIAKMPGMSEKGAERFIEWLWQQQIEKKDFGSNWSDFIKLKPCQKCFFFSYSKECDFCRDKLRDQKRVCVVTSPFTAGTIEKDTGYDGQYFILGGEAVSSRPSKAVETVKKRIDFLGKRVVEEKIKEIIVATDFTFRGEATAHYIKDKLKNSSVTISRLAQGFQTGSQVDYGDTVTLRKAMENRESY